MGNRVRGQAFGSGDQLCCVVPDSSLRVHYISARASDTETCEGPADQSRERREFLKPGSEVGMERRGWGERYQGQDCSVGVHICEVGTIWFE